jgi:hypothetical protein
MTHDYFAYTGRLLVRFGKAKMPLLSTSPHGDSIGTLIGERLHAAPIAGSSVVARNDSRTSLQSVTQDRENSR